MFAAYTDGPLVLGVAATEAAAIADAVAHGAEDNGDLDTLPITGPAIRYVQAGGDCRGLTIRTDRDGEEFIDLRPSAPPAPAFGRP